jgi:IS5 family transposase
MLRMYLLQCWFNLREEVQSSPYRSGKEYRINHRRKSVQQMPAGYIEWEKEIKCRKSFVRSKVEHPFLIVKCYFGFAKAVYRNLAQNTYWLYTLLASATLLMCTRAGRPLGPA